MGANKGRAASPAEEFRLKRLGQIQTGRTDRNPGDVGERPFTQPALIRKNCVESGRKNAESYCFQAFRPRVRTAGNVTCRIREDSPPLNPQYTSILRKGELQELKLLLNSAEVVSRGDLKISKHEQGHRWPIFYRFLFALRQRLKHVHFPR